jgi:hypothetical protein
MRSDNLGEACLYPAIPRLWLQYSNTTLNPYVNSTSGFGQPTLYIHILKCQIGARATVLRAKAGRLLTKALFFSVFFVVCVFIGGCPAKIGRQ